MTEQRRVPREEQERLLRESPLRIIAENAHVYFVHSYGFACADGDKVVATADYGGPLTAAVGRDNLLGTQFHPEKSQATGLALITNFLRWRP